MNFEIFGIRLWDSNMFIYYCGVLYERIPSGFMLLLLICLIVGFLTICCKSKPIKVKSKMILRLILAEYISFVLCTAVFLREPMNEYNLKLVPFWSYFSYVHEDGQLLTQIYLNILMFIPVGFLSGMIINEQNKKTKVLLLGFSLSVTIELLQLLFKRGICEIDDIMHNTIGCLLGLLMSLFMYSLLSQKKKLTDFTLSDR